MVLRPGLSGNPGTTSSKAFSKVLFKNTSSTQLNMLAVRLTEESPQEVEGAGPKTPGFKAGTNQLPGHPAITSNIHTGEDA